MRVSSRFPVFIDFVCALAKVCSKGITTRPNILAFLSKIIHLATRMKPRCLNVTKLHSSKLS